MIYFLNLIAQLIASTTHIVGKFLTADVSPEVVLLFRGIIASLAYFLWAVIFKKRIKIEKKDIIPIIILGALNIPLNQFLFLQSISLTSPPNVALAYALTPAFVLIIAIFKRWEYASPLKVMGILIAFIGAAMILSLDGFDFSKESALGNGLSLIASLSWAFFLAFGKRYTKKYGSFYLMGLTMVFGTTLYGGIYPALGEPIIFERISALNWLQIIYLGTITSVVSYGLFYYVLSKVDASKFAVFNNLQPIFTTILAVFFFDQELSALFIAGGGLIIIGVLAAQRGR